jgi:cytochrome b561
MKKADNNFTQLHRWLHWAIAAVISLSFITGFLHEFWMNKHQMAAKIVKGVQIAQLSHEHAIQLAESIRAPMWHWHVYAAYAMLFLFAARITYMLIKGIKFPHSFKDEMTVVDWLEWLSYALFYCFVGINIFTGFYLLWGRNNEWKALFEMIHKWAIYWFLFLFYCISRESSLQKFPAKKGLLQR